MMSEEFNINEFSAIWANLQVEKVAGWGAKAFSKITGNAKRKLRDSYAKYQTNLYDKYKDSKSFLLKTEPVSLYEYYVPSTLSLNDTILEDANIEHIFANGKFCVVTGLAGSGKSMLMRHFLLNSLKSDVGVPVFIELRRINGSDDTIEDLILETLEEHGFESDVEYVEEGISNGHFCFFFDGYDEVAKDKKSDVSKYIRRLSNANISNSVIVSSRPRV